jgi:hypothetical protein
LPRGTLKVYGELVNATNRHNACCVDYRLQTEGARYELDEDTDTSLRRYVFFGLNWDLP